MRVIILAYTFAPNVLKLPVNGLIWKQKKGERMSKRLTKVPSNHIVIDFDLKGPDGEKSAELSKSGKGIHLHYILSGDVSQLSSLYAEDMEVIKKVVHVVEITEERNTLLANTLNAQKHTHWENGTVTLKLSESQVEYLEKVLLSYPAFRKEK